MKTDILKKKVRLLPPTFWLVAIVGNVVASYLHDNLHLLTYLVTGMLLIHLIKSVFHNIYIPLIGCLIVDDNTIKLKAGRFSWSYVLDSVYKKEEFFSLFESIYFSEKVMIKKIIIQPDEWRLFDDEALGLTDVLAKRIAIKSYSEMSNAPREIKNYEPAIKQSLIILAVWFFILLLAGMYIHRYYSHNSGTPILFYIVVSLLTTGGFYCYLFNRNPDCESNISVTILAIIISLFSAPVMFKGYIIAFNEVETHRFQLVKKNGGYQHWQSLDDDTLEFKLGSVNNKIQTENDQGAIVTLKLIQSTYLTLYLPNQIERTRYKSMSFEGFN